MFHTPGEDGYATITISGHHETWPIRSKVFRNWLAHRFYDRERKPPGSQAVQDAQNLLEARAKFDGPEHPVFLRVAQTADAVYLDLCNATWETVEITGEGWQVIANPRVRFRRSRGMSPLPHPISGGSIEDLREFVNVPDERTWKLLVGFLVGSLRPKGPYPILILQGEAGSPLLTALLARRVGWFAARLALGCAWLVAADAVRDSPHFFLR